MKILDTQEGKGTTEGGRPVMSDLLGRYPDLDAVFPINDPSAPGRDLGHRVGRQARQGDGRHRRRLAGGGRRHPGRQAPFHLGTVPRQIGRVAAETIYDHLAGKPVPKDIKIPVKLITKENADEFLKSPVSPCPTTASATGPSSRCGA